MINRTLLIKVSDCFQSDRDGLSQIVIKSSIRHICTVLCAIIFGERSLVIFKHIVWYIIYFATSCHFSPRLLHRLQHLLQGCL